MAKIKSFSGDMLGALGGNVDYYYVRGKPVARLWPHHSKKDFTDKQKASQSAFGDARKALGKFPGALKEVYRKYFEGSGKSWVDFYTSEFIKYTLAHKKHPPQVSGIEFLQDGSDIILSFKSDRCEALNLWVYEGDFKNVSRAHFYHGSYDDCYGFKDKPEVEVIHSEPCYEFSGLEVPYNIVCGLEKQYFYNYIAPKLDYVANYFRFLNNIKYDIYLTTSPGPFFSTVVRFDEKQLPNGQGDYCGFIHNFGVVIKLDKGFIEKNHMLDKHEFICLYFDDTFEIQLNDPFKNCERFPTWFIGLRVNGRYRKFIQKKVVSKIYKKDLYDNGFYVYLYPDLFTDKYEEFRERFLNIKNYSISQWSFMPTPKNCRFLGAKTAPWIRFRIPLKYFSDRWSVGFKSAVGANFILPPMNLLDLVRSVCGDLGRLKNSKDVRYADLLGGCAKHLDTPVSRPDDPLPEW